MKRYYPPLLITGILISAHLSFGILEGYSRTGVAILVAISAEPVMGKLTYGNPFLLLSFVPSTVTGNTWLATVAPITGPMYQLFVFFMVTDPKTTVRSKKGQIVVVFLVALVEMFLRLNEVVYAPFYALFLVGPASLIVDEWMHARDVRSVRLQPDVLR